jgi:ribosomal protein S18 acetylase RimI-like enzyme
LVWPALCHLEGTYPGFRRWYWGKVVPGIASGERAIIVSGNEAAPHGVVIAKLTPHERKICTVWVDRPWRGRRLGLSLMMEAMDWLQTDQPLLTVPAERYVEFIPIVGRLGFTETARIRSLYRAGVVEHVFNGPIIFSRQA